MHAHGNTVCALAGFRKLERLAQFNIAAERHFAARANERVFLNEMTKLKASVRKMA